MYRDEISATEAWSRFFTLFKQNIFSFLVYGFIIFGLTIMVVIGVVFAVIFTCCIGGLLLVIPYISSVLLLPISYTYRALGLEFLSQFGDEYTLFPAPEMPGETASQ